LEREASAELRSARSCHFFFFLPLALYRRCVQWPSPHVCGQPPDAQSWKRRRTARFAGPPRGKLDVGKSPAKFFQRVAPPVAHLVGAVKLAAPHCWPSSCELPGGEMHKTRGIRPRLRPAKFSAAAAKFPLGRQVSQGTRRGPQGTWRGRQFCKCARQGRICKLVLCRSQAREGAFSSREPGTRSAEMPSTAGSVPGKLLLEKVSLQRDPQVLRVDSRHLQGAVEFGSRKGLRAPLAPLTESRAWRVPLVNLLLDAHGWPAVRFLRSFVSPVSNFTVRRATAASVRPKNKKLANAFRAASQLSLSELHGSLSSCSCFVPYNFTIKYSTQCKSASPSETVFAAVSMRLDAVSKAMIYVMSLCLRYTALRRQPS
jgi:hypothetical protein